MEFTLFIDESGDFETTSQEWVVSGVLLPLSHGAAGRLLDSVLNDVCREYQLGNVADLHLTEIRRKSCLGGKAEFAAQVADMLFDRIVSVTVPDTLPAPVRLFAVRNRSHTALSAKEKTYRTMLLDLIALAEAKTALGRVASHFEVVVATRTDGLGDRMTTCSDLNSAFLGTLPGMIEDGLVSRGLANLVTSNRFSWRHRAQRGHPGLTVADFLANVVYNRFHAEESALLQKLELADRFFLFDALGGYELRKGRIAERDGDFIGAVYWMALASERGGQQDDEYIRLLRRTERAVDSTGIMTTLDGAIERMWQDRRNPTSGGYSRISGALQRLEHAIVEIGKVNASATWTAALFRLRTFQLSVANHRGDSAQSRRLVAAQSEAQRKIPGTPEHYPLHLAFELASIETAVNDLDNMEAIARAEHYCQTVSAFRDIWQMIGEYEGDIRGDFQHSRISLKANTTLLRCRVLDAELPIDIAESESIHKQLIEEVEALTALVPDSVDDRSRLKNLKVQLLLKSGAPQRALSLAYKDFKEGNSNIFDAFWLARSAGDLLISHGASEVPCKVLSYISGARLSHVLQGDDHPRELIWREQAVLEWQLGDIARAEESFKAAVDLHSKATAHDSAINCYLRALLGLHLTIFSDASTAIDILAFHFIDNCSASLTAQSLAKRAYEATLTSGGNAIGLLRFARNYSPF